MSRCPQQRDPFRVSTWPLIVLALGVISIGCGTVPQEADLTVPDASTDASADVESPDSADPGDVGTGEGRTDEGCHLVATPSALELGRTADGWVECQTVTAANVGTAACTIVGYRTVSSSGVFLTEPFATYYPRGRAVLDPAGVAPGPSQMTIDVCVAPDAQRHDSGSLDIDLATATGVVPVRVPVEANRGHACIEVAPALDFGRQLLGLDVSRNVTITNCAPPDSPLAETLVIHSLEWADAEGEAAIVLGDNVVPIEIAAGDSTAVQVLFRPREAERRSERILRVGSSDSAQPSVDVTVTGVAAESVCPTSAPVCRISGSTDPPSSSVAAIPLDTLECTPGASNDADGQIVGYEWSVVEQPDGSTTRFDTPTSLSSTLFVDLAGHYLLQLVTTDNDGCASEPGLVTVYAVPNEDIHIQLTWDTPSDRDQTDTRGSDIDLHFLHPSGCWTDSVWDCHFRNVSPNWGDRTRSDDNPSVDIDDVDGAGPENINLNNPEDGLTYRVGVHHWNDWGFGPSDATVRVYIRGALVSEAKRESLSNDEFWEVASIDWPSGTVTSIDRVYANIEDAPCR